MNTDFACDKNDLYKEDPVNDVYRFTKKDMFLESSSQIKNGKPGE